MTAPGAVGYLCGSQEGTNADLDGPPPIGMAGHDDSPANSWNATNARGPQIVPGPPFIIMATPMASATSCELAPREAAPPAWN